VISPNALTAWRTTHPWADDEQVEQDLIMTRVAIEIANDPYLGNVLAWRGGTCLHKLFLPTALRYSDDLDYVAYGLSIENNDMRQLRAALRNVAERIGLEIGAHPKTTSERLNEHFTYTSLGAVRRRIKVEINLDEVPAVSPLDRRPLSARTDWWVGSADVLTFVPVELLATKFRALAQRRKGRDLNDLNVAHEILGLDDTALAAAAAHYLHHAAIAPTAFRARLAAHGEDPEFTNDTGVYLIDPELAHPPAALVNRWILWSDRHLDLQYAQRAYDMSPSNRKLRTIDDIRQRLDRKTVQCPIYRADSENAQRCEYQLDATGTCPVHGQPLGA
jgi:predicted nucleotidyltransferase component of viral defense system